MEMPDAKMLSSRLPRVEHKADLKEIVQRGSVVIRRGFVLPREACQLAVFLGKLPSMEAEIDDKLPPNSS
jgi:hypothetical protein